MTATSGRVPTDLEHCPGARAPSLQTRTKLSRLFSFRFVSACALIFLTVWFERSHLSDADVWWHLKHGETIWEQHRIPANDTYSFTAAGQPYTDHEWLAELMIFAAWKADKYEGLMVWLALFSSGIIVAMYLLCFFASGDAIVALLGAVATWSLATVGLALRPQLIGYLLLVCELLILHLSSTRTAKWLFALPAIFALWVNCHGSFVLGLAVLTVFVIGSRVKVNCGLIRSRPFAPQQRELMLPITALSIVALFLNPIGADLVLYPANMLFKQPLNVATIAEWQRLSFGDARAWIVFGMAGSTCLIALMRKSTLYLDELALLALGVVLSALHVRMMFFFGIIGAPILCRQLAGFEWREETGHGRKFLNAAIAVLLGILVIREMAGRQLIQSQVEQENPTGAINFLRRTHTTGRMLNAYGYGGYLIWTAPEYKVFIDSRTDIYERTGVLNDYINWLLVRTDPRNLLEKYQIDFCLLPTNIPIVRVMRLLPGWQVAYSDNLSVVIENSGVKSPRISQTTGGVGQ